MNARERLERVLPLMRQAADLALQSFGRVEGRMKHDRSVVTEVDLQVEQLLVEGLQRRFPGEAIVGEETGQQGRLDGPVWSIDPIDGTAAYLSRLPHWGVSLGFLMDGEPVCGIVDMPAVGEIYCAAKGSGAWMETARWGRERLEVDARPLSGESLLCVPSNVHRRYEVEFPGKLRCLGSTVAHVLLVARGDAVGSVGRVSLWDLAGCASILQEAGGRMGTLDGRPVRLTDLVPENGPPPPVLAAAGGHFEGLRRSIRLLPRRAGEPRRT